MSWDTFTIALTDGQTITETPAEPRPPLHAPASVRIESYGIEISGHYAANRTYIPWHQIARIDVGDSHRKDGAA